MSITSFDDFADYWADLRPEIRVRPTQKATVESDLEAVSASTLKKLTEHLVPLQGHPLTTELLAQTVVTGLRMFMSEWYENQRKHDLGVLLEIILDGQKDLPIEEIRGFIQALPRRLIDRILKELRGQATGLHALLSLEVRRRDGLLRDYTLSYDADKRVVVTFVPMDNQNPNRDAITFTLREIFSVQM